MPDNLGAPIPEALANGGDNIGLLVWRMGVVETALKHIDQSAKDRDSDIQGKLDSLIADNSVIAEMKIRIQFLERARDRIAMSLVALFFAVLPVAYDTIKTIVTR